jgi:uncharacterized protein YndB with AHSA1/START domain
MSGDPIARDLTFELPGSPEDTFRAWTSEDEIVGWWGEDGTYWTTAWRAEFRGADGESFGAERRYLEVDRPRRLVWTWRADCAPEEEITIEMGFAALASGTRMSLRQTGFSVADDIKGHDETWRQVVGWLTKRLAAPNP